MRDNSNMELEGKWITNEQEFIGLSDVWKELFSRNNAHSIFLSWEWVSNWWKVFGGGRQLDVLCVRDASTGQLCAIIPLYKVRRNVLGKTIMQEWCFIGADSIACSDHLGILLAEELNRPDFDSILDLIWEHVGKNGSLNFTDLQPEDPLIENTISWAKGRSIQYATRKGNICPRMRLSSSWDGFLKQLSSNFRSQVRSSYRKVLGNPDMVIKNVTDIEHAHGYIDELMQLNLARMEQKNQISSFSQPSMKVFFNNVSMDMLEAGSAWFDVLLNKDELVAASFHMKHGDTIYYYQGGFNPGYSRWRPSTVIFAHVIQRAIDHGYRYFDFLRGDEQYKYRWQAEPVENVELLLYSDRPMAKTNYSIQKNYRRIKNVIYTRLGARTSV